MTSVYGVQSWDEVGVGVVFCLWPLAPICLLHAQASASTITWGKHAQTPNTRAQPPGGWKVRHDAVAPREGVEVGSDKGLLASVRNALPCRPPFSSDLCARASYGVRGEQTRVYTRRAMPRDLAIRAPGGLLRVPGGPSAHPNASACCAKPPGPG